MTLATVVNLLTAAALSASSADLPRVIQALIDARDPAIGITRAEQAELQAFYRPDGYSARWLDASGRPDRNADDALALLAAAADEGLDPADYDVRQLDRSVDQPGAESPAPLRDVACFDVALSSRILRYLRDLHSGRVDPRTIGFRLSVPVDQHDFAALLRAALAGRRLKVVAADMAPPFAQYRALLARLAQYRALSAAAALERPLQTTVTVRPGEPFGEPGPLYRQLIAVGDLPPGTPPPAATTLYDGTLVEGIKRFQTRHGLESDGVLGKATLSALRIPLAWRVRQIELAIERLRWLPHLGDERLVLINIPMFRLAAWDSIPPDETPALGMDVIVGRALSTQTPVFVEQMREVIIRPYWNIPPSILRKEILPIIERDAGYLQRQNMEIVRGPGDDARPVEATLENIERLRQGALRLRQRPGPRNALGLIKFVFPNEENVYMHGTPAPELFNRRRRDFSHGCVRVQDPVALAAWTLKDTQEWTRDRILEAMAGPRSVHVKLTRPIQVILFYTTAAVAPEDGTIRFAEDIYRHDARLDRALATRRSGQ